MPDPDVTFDEFVATCTPLAKFPDFEAQMKERVCAIVARLLKFEYESEGTEGLIAFMQEDLDFLKLLLKMVNLSQEKFKRVISADRFARGDFGNEWDVKAIHARLKRDIGFAHSLAEMFLAGRQGPLIEQVADFYLEQLRFPESWTTILQDKRLAAGIAREMLSGEYSDRKGDHVEYVVAQTLAMATEPRGLAFEKGKVDFLGKEADLAVPGIQNPDVTVMISYTETTSSSQTARANEQAVLFDEINKWNRRNRTNKVLVNVLDGGGWLARKSDMRKMFDLCHYCLNLNTLDRFGIIIERHAAR